MVVNDTVEKSENEPEHKGVIGPLIMPPVIAKALLAVQKELKPLVKSEVNDEYGSGFVPLHEVVDAAIELLSKHNVFVSQPVVTDENDHLALRTMLVHRSGVGYSETSRLALGKADPQGHGSAITYARRYNLMAMLGMTAKEDDDDGNKASGVSAPAKPEQIERIKSLLRHLKFPPDQVSHEIRNIRTRDHATQAIVNWEKVVSQKVREREAESNALATDAETKHVAVTGEDGGSLMQEVEQRIKALNLVSKSAENKFVSSVTTSCKPWLAKCNDADLEELSQMLDFLEAGVRTLPDDWYAAGHPPIKQETKEGKTQETKE